MELPAYVDDDDAFSAEEVATLATSLNAAITSQGGEKPLHPVAADALELAGRGLGYECVRREQPYRSSRLRISTSGSPSRVDAAASMLYVLPTLVCFSFRCVFPYPFCNTPFLNGCSAVLNSTNGLKRRIFNREEKNAQRSVKGCLYSDDDVDVSGSELFRGQYQVYGQLVGAVEDQMALGGEPPFYSYGMLTNFIVSAVFYADLVRLTPSGPPVLRLVQLVPSAPGDAVMGPFTRAGTNSAADVVTEDAVRRHLKFCRRAMRMAAAGPQDLPTKPLNIPNVVGGTGASRLHVFKSHRSSQSPSKDESKRSESKTDSYFSLSDDLLARHNEAHKMTSAMFPHLADHRYADRGF